jgi:hypothetical protein
MHNGGWPKLFSGCRCFNALQIRGQGRALLVLFLRAFGVPAAEPARACRGITYNSFCVDFWMTGWMPAGLAASRPLTDCGSGE